MFEETQKRDSECLKLPRGKVPTNQEISAAINKLSVFGKISARTTWNAAKSLEERTPQQAADKLVNYLSTKPCEPEKIGLDQAKQLFLQELEKNAQPLLKDRVRQAQKTLKNTIQEIRTNREND